jgi:hypothetical protein
MDLSLRPTYTIREIIELASRVAVGAGATFFATGLLIVNAHLSQYGVYSSDFIRTEYIIVGAAFFALITCAGLGIEYCTAKMKGAVRVWREQHRWRDGFGILGAVVGGVAIPVYVLSFLSSFRLGYLNWKTWLALLIFATIYRHFRESRTHLTQLWRSAIAAPEDRNTTDIVHRGEQLSSGFVGFLALVGTYAELIYPDLSPIYGGGHKDPVVLITSARGGEVSAAAALPLLKDGTVGPVQLLTESDKATPSGSSSALRRRRPLRTGRAGHPASGSSQSSAPESGTEQIDGTLRGSTTK